MYKYGSLQVDFSRKAHSRDISNGIWTFLSQVELNFLIGDYVSDY